jgi:hypothetical protein
MQFRDLAVTFVIALVSAETLGAECATLALPNDFARSGAVFVGRAVDQSVVTGAESKRVETETTFDVDQSWKGTVETDKKIRVRTCGGTLGETSFTCGETFRFAVGSRYIVFAEGQPFTTDTCHHTATVDQGARTLHWLSTKPSRKPSRR